MEAPEKVIRLKYASGEKFAESYAHLREGRISYHSRSAMREGALLAIELHLPEIEQVFLLNGVVIRAIDLSHGKDEKKLYEITVAFTESSFKELARLESALRGREEYRRLLGLAPPAPERAEEISAAGAARAAPPPAPAETPKKTAAPAPVPPPQPIPLAPADEKDEIEITAAPKFPPPPPSPPAASPPKPTSAASAVSSEKTNAGLSLEWLREVVGKEDREIKEEEETPPPPPPMAEKKELSPAERERVKPVGEFIMDLVKAMLRSGYYSPDHPGSKGAKVGLYEELMKALGEANEIVLTNQETREKTDVLISGILEEPVSVRTVVGAGMAEMFVPKFREYFNRKGLVSFALKKEMSPQHFEAFVDIMSDPKADRGENAKVGELLTRALVEHGITEISTVFLDDMIVFEEALPWRAEMAIHRLGKDLKVLPMFKGYSEEEIRAMKVRIIKDIIRPLRHPHLLKDIVLNCYVIARHVSHLKAEELEQTIIDAFPMQILLPTSRFIFDELDQLKKKMDKSPDNPLLHARYQGVRRILKWVARRVVMEEIPGAERFLEQLYFKEILAFEELPPEVQYRINTIRLAEAVKENPQEYAQGVQSASNPEDALVYLRALRRVAPILIEQTAWSELAVVTAAVAAAPLSLPSGDGKEVSPLEFIFGEHEEALAEAYQKAGKSQLEHLDRILGHLGPLGVEVLVKVLGRSENRGIRKAAVDTLIKINLPALQRLRQILDDSAQPWFVQRNALLILGQIGEEKNDRKRIERFLAHPHPRLREEALTSLLRLVGKKAEPALLAALDDKEPHVQRRALACFALLHPPPEAFSRKILALLAAERPKDKDEAASFDQKLIQIIRALPTFSELPLLNQIETALLAILERKTQKGGFLKRLKKAIEREDDPALLLATVESLAKVGGKNAIPVLRILAEEEPPLGKKARETLNAVSLRTAD